MSMFCFKSGYMLILYKVDTMAIFGTSKGLFFFGSVFNSPNNDAMTTAITLDRLRHLLNFPFHILDRITRGIESPMKSQPSNGKSTPDNVISAVERTAFAGQAKFTVGKIKYQSTARHEQQPRIGVHPISTPQEHQQARQGKYEKANHLERSGLQ